MKNIFILITTLFCCTSLFSQEYIKKYSGVEEWFSETEKNYYVSFYEIELRENSADKKEIKANIKHTLLPFSQIIKNEVTLKLKKNKYEFSFVDGWRNRAYGWVDFEKENPILFLDCKKFSSEGKNFARLYGDSIELQDTSDDMNYFKKVIDGSKKIHNLLFEKNNMYFPYDDENHKLLILYIGKINDIEIYKTTLVWNLKSSGRMTHRMVFVQNNKVTGIYTGIQSDKIVVNANTILFKDIELNNIIEINEALPEKILIDGDIVYLEK